MKSNGSHQSQQEWVDKDEHQQGLQPSWCHQAVEGEGLEGPQVATAGDRCTRRNIKSRSNHEVFK